MLEEISYYPVFGIPLIVYGGILTLVSLLITAAIMVLNKRGITKISIKWHHWMATVTVVLGLIHGLLAILAYF
jgi:hypothetical protein